MNNGYAWATRTYTFGERLRVRALHPICQIDFIDVNIIDYNVK